MVGHGPPGTRRLTVAARLEPIAPLRVEVRSATSERWPDVVTILGGNGELGCWCQAWRGSLRPRGRGERVGNRERLRAQVETGAFAPGVIAYVDGTPVGWCGLGPRASMPRLVGSRTIPVVDDLPVWSTGASWCGPGSGARASPGRCSMGRLPMPTDGRTRRRGLPDRTGRRTCLNVTGLRRVPLDLPGRGFRTNAC